MFINTTLPEGFILQSYKPPLIFDEELTGKAFASENHDDNRNPPSILFSSGKMTIDSTFVRF